MSDVNYNEENYLEVLEVCKNKSNFGCACHEICVFRENRSCEMDKNRAISILLTKLLGEEIVYDENIVSTLHSMATNRGLL